jgi:hypothetical protein
VAAANDMGKRWVQANLTRETVKQDNKVVSRKILTKAGEKPVIRGARPVAGHTGDRGYTWVLGESAIRYYSGDSRQTCRSASPARAATWAPQLTTGSGAFATTPSMTLAAYHRATRAGQLAGRGLRRAVIDPPTTNSCALTMDSSPLWPLRFWHGLRPQAIR